MTPCYLFDIDGTLADLTHRLHHIQKEPKDWDSFFAACPNDKPIRHMCDLAFHLLKAGHCVVFVSGRSDRVRAQTRDWLGIHVGVFDPQIFMRRDGDRAPDDVVKVELLGQIRARGWEPIMAFDDRDSVVAMWRAQGIPCAQVAPGDF